MGFGFAWFNAKSEAELDCDHVEGHPRQCERCETERWCERESEEGCWKLRVTNVAWEADEAMLMAAFESHQFYPRGVEIMRKRNGRSMGFGFAWFGTQSEAGLACDYLEGHVLCGRDLHLEFA
eukprot:m51a1_g3183 hypothetical protein (123) ;mRNA; r:418825-421266